MQFSIELVPWPEMPGFLNASSAVIPLAWIEVVKLYIFSDRHLKILYTILGMTTTL